MNPAEGDHSVLREWWDSATATFSNLNEFWKQRSRILQDPNCAVDHTAKLAHKPLKFALNMIIVPAVLISASGTALKYVPMLPPLPLEREIATLEKVKDVVIEAGRDGEGMKMPTIFDDDIDTKLAAMERQNEKQDQALKDVSRDLPFEIEMPLSFASLSALEPANRTRAELAVITSALGTLRTQQREATLMTPIYRFMVPISLVATALLFRIFLSKYRTAYPKVWKADKAYLYYVAARLFFPNAVALTGLYAIELASRFTRGNVEDVESLKELLVIVCGIWGLVALKRSAPVLREILGFDAEAAAPGKNLVRNRLLLASLTTGISTFALLRVVGRVVMNILS